MHGATEVIDEILSDEENKDEKKLKDPELILDNKHVKDLDNRYREEQGDIVLIKRDDPNLRVDEKHQVEQMVKEETVENVAVEVENETHDPVVIEPKYEEVKDTVLKPAATSPTKSSLKTVDSSILKQRNSQNNLPESAFKPIKESVSFGDVKSIDSKPKDSGANFKPERRVSIQNFAEVQEEDEVLNKCNNEPDQLISRAPLTFAMMQTDEKTPDDHLDENATRAAPYTVASQWNASQFPSSSESQAEDESEGEIGGAKTKSQMKKPKRFQHNTLMDEEDMKMDSVLRNSLVLADADGQDCLRNSLVFLGDDSAALSANDSDNEKKHGGKSKSGSFAEKSKQEKSLPTTSISYKMSGHSKMPEKLAKEMDNLISSPLRNSPTKHLFKPKESLTDLKKLAALSHIKPVTSTGKPPAPQPVTTKKDHGSSVDKPAPVKPALKPKPKQLPNLKVLVGSSVDKVSDEGSSVDGDRKAASVSNVDAQVKREKEKPEELASNSSFLSQEKFGLVSVVSNKQSLKPLEERTIGNSTGVSSIGIGKSVDNIDDKLNSLDKKPEDIKTSESVIVTKRELPLPGSQIPVRVDKLTKHSTTNTAGTTKAEGKKEVSGYSLVKESKTDVSANETSKSVKHLDTKFSEKEIQKAELEHLRARKKMSPIVEERNGEIASKSTLSVEHLPSSTKSTSSEPSVGKEEKASASVDKNQVERRHSFKVDLKPSGIQEENKGNKVEVPSERQQSTPAERSSSVVENRTSSQRNEPGNKKPVRRRSSSASRISDRTANELREALAAVTPTPPDNDPSKVPKPPPGAAPKNTVLLNARSVLSSDMEVLAKKKA